ncbi:AAA family ATPase [Mycobacterium shinjukuense]|uniref:AAA family ATPase n=1 Tax=Mycobacterium shinjukuense TaxID=398694 RepID=UPI0021F3ACDE|nr:AAA family ATPase [Mycobacterium shinjukuense]
MIDGHDAAARLRRALDRAPAVLLTRPRQVGKTTLSRLVSRSTPECTIDAENPVHAARLADAMLALSGLSGLITIDEAQRIPGLFPVVRVLVDRPGMPAPSVIGADLRPVVDAPYR